MKFILRLRLPFMPIQWIIFTYFSKLSIRFLVIAYWENLLRSEAATLILPSSTPTSTSTRFEWLYSQHPQPPTHPPEKYGMTSGMKHTTPTSTPSFLYNISYNF